jgi:hypothetical protein
MLSSLLTRSLPLTALTLWASSALACTVANAGPTAHATLNSANSGVMQMTLMGARTKAEPGRKTERGLGRVNTLATRTPVLATTEDATNSHPYQPIAMLAAALALMVSIALRRSGKH